MKTTIYKSISIILAVIMIISMTTTAFAATADNSADTVTAQVDETIEAASDEIDNNDDNNQSSNPSSEATESLSDSAKEESNADTVSDSNNLKESQEETKNNSDSKRNSKKGKNPVGANIDKSSTGAVSYTYSNGTLTLSGSGAMTDYTDSTHAPWWSNRNSITTIKISNDITSIGNYAFYACSNLTTVIGGKDVISIGKHAFYKCEKLKCWNPGETITVENALRTYNYINNGDSIYSSVVRYADTSNTIIFPRNIKYIYSNAFENDYSLQYIGWIDSSTSAQITEIGTEAFKNCVGLKYINLPDSIKTIGTSAFYIDRVRCENLEEGTYTAPNTLFLGIQESFSNLKNINANAFKVYKKVTVDGTNKLGMRFYSISPSSTSSTKGRTIGENNIFVFYNLEYIGGYAFDHRYDLTGIFQFGDTTHTLYTTISSHVFRGTNITDLYFRWSPSKNTDNSYTPNPDDNNNYWSSIIGSSNTYLVPNSTSKGYKSNVALPRELQEQGGWYNLHSILEDTQKGLFTLWKKDFEGLSSSSVDLSDKYSALFNQPLTVGQDYIKNSVPNSANGRNNNQNVNNPNTNTTSKNYLQSNVTWLNGASGIAKEDVYFSYQNSTPVDYVFILDVSGSMDVAADGNKAALRDTYNASRMMNTYAIMCKMTEKILENQTETAAFSNQTDDNNKSKQNTVSIVAFANTDNGGNDNMYNASDTLCTAVSSAATVKTNLFNYQVPESTGTHYGSGFARAYYLLKDLQENTYTANHKKVCIMISDGKPVLYDNERRTDWSHGVWTNAPAESPWGNRTENQNAAAEWGMVSGLDWAAAIRDDRKVAQNIPACERDSISAWYGGKANDPSTQGFRVHKFGTSASDTTTRDNCNNTDNIIIVPGLGIPIYGILVGSNEFTNINYAVGLKEDDFESTNDFNTTPDGELTFGGENMRDLPKALNSIADEMTAEDYYVTIPLDRNFILSDYTLGGTDYKLTTSYLTNDSDLVVDSSYTEINKFRCSNITDKYSYDYSENDNLNGLIGTTNHYSLPENLDGGVVKYDSNRNAIIWNLSKANVPSGTRTITKTLSGANKVYKLTFYLKYLGYNSGAIVSKKTVTPRNFPAFTSVNNNGFNTSQNGDATSQIHSAIDVSNSANPTNGNDGTYTGNGENATGIYTFIADYTNQSSAVESVGSTSTQHSTNERNATLTNTAAAIYLPLYEIKLSKKSDSNPSGNDLSGAVFEIYDGSNSKVTVYPSAGYNNYYRGETFAPQNTFTNRTTSGDYRYKLQYFPPGNYTIKEVTAPANHIIEKSTSTTNKQYSVTIAYPENNNVFNMGGTTTTNTEKTLTVYNNLVGTLRIHVDSSDSVKQNFKFNVQYSFVNSSNNTETYTYQTGTSNSSGLLELTNVPLYEELSEGVYAKRTYIVTETQYNNGSIPSRYIAKEYGDSWSTAINASNYSVSEFPKSKNYTEDVYVYNPSIRVVVRNYDADDRTTPLQSRFTLNSESITTGSDGTVQSSSWYGYSTNTLTQIAVPSGYNLLKDSESIKLNSSTPLETKYDAVTGNKYYKYTYTVYNSKNTNIPNTGANSTLWYIIIGVLLIIMGTATVLILRFKSAHKKAS